MGKKRKSILDREAFLSYKSIFLVLAIVVVAGCLLSLAFVDDIKMADKTVKDIELVTLTGDKRYDAGIFAESELTVVNVWATFCAPCIREMPEFGEVSREYADKGVKFLGVCGDIKYDQDGTPDPGLLSDAFAIIEATGADYLQCMPTPEYDPYLGELISNSFPGTFLVNSDGEIVRLFVGSIQKDVLVSAIEQALDRGQGGS